ncbi:GDSL-type esterase/lipase family protein [Chitinophaga sp. GCM10012297]|uniref:SGNH hydrolase-type esterase domain-containing protein n=1 Tax=Chitinophaga chungangae TaxID=2821488 RepID=A0ABS3YIK6_9BACT|nr:GDSL-type esterase/lipase family protein [Chitinophaga chungangae]MBO9154474.1 hypothetical protein [Chitinophaga chungangae]
MGSCAAFAQRKHLYNDTSLYPVYALMRQTGDTVISILHVGDSHVQAGFFPDAVKNRLQEKFGDAGPGWVFPYNLAGTNGPNGYRWSSNVRWNEERMVQRNISQWTGPGGISIGRPEGPAQLNFTGQPVKKMTYWFEGKAMLPEDKSSSVFEDELEKDLRVAELNGDSARNVAKANFSFIGRFYGAVAENGEPGILYHAIGINGAQFSHYNQFGGRTAVSQMELLKPALVIVSLGTNEAFGGVAAAQLRLEIEKMTGEMKKINPEVRFLFTTPPSGMMKKRQVPYKKKGKKRTYYRVSYTKVPQATTLRDAMITLCNENGWAYWDLFGAMKADARFARAWSGDRVHFNAYGYGLQGQLLAEAVLASYEQWNQTNVKP